MDFGIKNYNKYLEIEIENLGKIFFDLNINYKNCLLMFNVTPKNASSKIDLNYIFNLLNDDVINVRSIADEFFESQNGSLIYNKMDYSTEQFNQINNSSMYESNDSNLFLNYEILEEQIILYKSDSKYYYKRRNDGKYVFNKMCDLNDKELLKNTDSYLKFYNDVLYKIENNIDEKLIYFQTNNDLEIFRFELKFNQNKLIEIKGCEDGVFKHFEITYSNSSVDIHDLLSDTHYVINFSTDIFTYVKMHNNKIIDNYKIQYFSNKTEVVDFFNSKETYFFDSRNLCIFELNYDNNSFISTSYKKIRNYYIIKDISQSFILDKNNPLFFNNNYFDDPFCLSINNWQSNNNTNININLLNNELSDLIGTHFLTFKGINSNDLSETKIYRDISIEADANESISLNFIFKYINLINNNLSDDCLLKVKIIACFENEEKQILEKEYYKNCFCDDTLNLLNCQIQLESTIDKVRIEFISSTNYEIYLNGFVLLKEPLHVENYYNEEKLIYSIDNGQIRRFYRYEQNGNDIFSHSTFNDFNNFLNIYDNNGRIKKAISHKENCVEYSYDNDDNLIEEKISNGTANSIKRFSFDNYKLIAKEENNICDEYSYDSYNRFITETSPNNIVKNISYSNANISEISIGLISNNFEYNNENVHLLKRVAQNNIAYEFSYSDEFNVEDVLYCFNLNNLLIEHFNYLEIFDGDNTKISSLPTEKVYSSNYKIAYSYDSKFRLINASQIENSVESVFFELSFDSLDRITNDGYYIYSYENNYLSMIKDNNGDNALNYIYYGGDLNYVVYSYFNNEMSNASVSNKYCEQLTDVSIINNLLIYGGYYGDYRYKVHVDENNVNHISFNMLHLNKDNKYEDKYFNVVSLLNTNIMDYLDTKFLLFNNNDSLCVGGSSDLECEGTYETAISFFFEPLPYVLSDNDNCLFFSLNNNLHGEAFYIKISSSGRVSILYRCDIDIHGSQYENIVETPLFIKQNLNFISLRIKYNYNLKKYLIKLKLNDDSEYIVINDMFSTDYTKYILRSFQFGIGTTEAVSFNNPVPLKSKISQFQFLVGESIDDQIIDYFKYLFENFAFNQPAYSLSSYHSLEEDEIYKNNSLVNFERFPLTNSLISLKGVKPHYFGFNKSDIGTKMMFLYDSEINDFSYISLNKTLCYDVSNLCLNGTILFKIKERKLNKSSRIFEFKTNNVNIFLESPNNTNSYRLNINGTYYNLSQEIDLSTWNKIAFSWFRFYPSSQYDNKYRFVLYGENSINLLDVVLDLDEFAFIKFYVGSELNVYNPNCLFKDLNFYNGYYSQNIANLIFNNKQNIRFLRYFDVFENLNEETVSINDNSLIKISHEYLQVNNQISNFIIRDRVFKNSNNVQIHSNSYNLLNGRVSSKIINGVGHYYTYSGDKFSAESGTNFTTSVIYGSNSNISSLTVNGTTFNYYYDDSSIPDKLTRVNNVYFKYEDANRPLYPTSIGNSDPYGHLYSGWNISWIYTKPKTFTKISDPTYTISFIYDSKGRRVCKNVNGVEHKYFYDQSDHIIAEQFGSTLLEFIYDSLGKLKILDVTQDGVLNRYFYVLDASDDVVAILDSNLNKCVSYDYNAFGKMVINGSMALTLGNLNPFRYKSYYYDREIGYYWLYSRFYSGEFGRFISPDKFDSLNAKDVHGLNLFNYCGVDPINYKDKDGHSISLALSFIITFVVGFGITILNLAYKNDWELSSSDFLQASIDGVFSVIGLLLCLTSFGIVASICANAILGFMQYCADSFVQGEKILLRGVLLSTAIGGLSGLIGGRGIFNEKSIIKEFVGLDNKGVKAFSAIVTANSNFIAGSTSKKGLQGVLNIYKKKFMTSYLTAISKTLYSSFKKATILNCSITMLSVCFGGAASYFLLKEYV